MHINLHFALPFPSALLHLFPQPCPAQPQGCLSHSGLIFIFFSSSYILSPITLSTLPACPFLSHQGLHTNPVSLHIVHSLRTQSSFWECSLEATAF
ncbi:mCG147176 [Mus musculus]|nr:mCG147176 [Mus musculus]